MTLYALYPLTNKRADSSHAGAASESSILAYKAVEAVAQWIVRRYRRAEAIRELSRLSDRMLKDIGMHRGEIREVVEAQLDAPAARPVAPRPVVKASPFVTSEIPAAANDDQAIIAVSR